MWVYGQAINTIMPYVFFSGEDGKNIGAVWQSNPVPEQHRKPLPDGRGAAEGHFWVV